MILKNYLFEEVCETITDYVANGSFKSLADNVVYSEKKDYARLIRLVDKNCDYNEKKAVWVSKQSYDFLKKSMLSGNEIIISNVGANLGTVFKCPKLSYPMTLGPNSILVKTNDLCNQDYLYYYLKSKQGYDKLMSLVSGSAMPKFNKTDLRNMTISIPEKKYQERVVKLLTILEEKIEINKKINNNLYEMGDALYNEYFGQYKDKLPKGYRIVKLNEVANNYDSRRKPMSSREREQHKGIYPYYGATSIIDYVDNYIFDDTYLLMGEDGTVKTEDGFPVLQYIWGKNWINNHAHVLKGNSISTELLMFALRKINIENIITGAVQPKINQENMNKIEFAIGTDSKNEELERILSNLMNKSKNIIEEIELLEKLRDTLLPKLMNGEIDLDSIEV